MRPRGRLTASESSVAESRRCLESRQTSGVTTAKAIAARAAISAWEKAQGEAPRAVCAGIIPPSSRSQTAAGERGQTGRAVRRSSSASAESSISRRAHARTALASRRFAGIAEQDPEQLDAALAPAGADLRWPEAGRDRRGGSGRARRPPGDRSAAAVQRQIASLSPRAAGAGSSVDELGRRRRRLDQAVGDYRDPPVAVGIELPELGPTSRRAPRPLRSAAWEPAISPTAIRGLISARWTSAAVVIATPWWEIPGRID